MKEEYAHKMTFSIICSHRSKRASFKRMKYSRLARNDENVIMHGGQLFFLQDG
jgi:hypothetical protein